MAGPIPSAEVDLTVRCNRSAIPTPGGVEVPAVFSYTRMASPRRGTIGQAFYRRQRWSSQRTRRDSSNDEDLEATLAHAQETKPDKRARRMVEDGSGDIHDNDDNINDDNI